ncbi:MAG TPA: hypothetical protein VE978_23670 [Chitinophagales bacterium]|nr:hypothetical protein [Chitinophagales bacterium]
MKKNIVLIVVAIVVLAIVYLVYDLVKPSTVSPCESVFRQSEANIHASLEVIKSKGEISVGPQKIQDLTGEAQKVALNLKTCCILNMNNKLTADEFLQCQKMGDDYEKNISDLAQNVTEAQTAKAEGNESLAEQKIAHINELLTTVDQTAQALLQHSSQLAAAHPEGLTDQKPQDKNLPEITSNDKTGRINLLFQKNGGQILLAPTDSWKGTNDSIENSVETGGEGTYGFKDGRKATFDMFCMFISETSPYNIHRFQLLYSNDDDYINGKFDSIGTFNTVNAKIFSTPYQEFKFPKVTARYFRVKVLSMWDSSLGYSKEYQLWGTLK